MYDMQLALAVNRHVAVHQQGGWNLGIFADRELQRTGPRQPQADVQLPCKCSRQASALLWPPNPAVHTALQAFMGCI